MTDDNWSDITVDFGDDPASFFAVPGDHPAFRQREDDDESVIGDGEPDGYGGTNDASASPIVQLPVGRYDGFSDKDHSEMVGVDGTDDPRQRTADAAFVRDRLDRARETIATRAIGQRNAIAHSRSAGEGAGSGGEDVPSPLEAALAESLEQAGVRFRDERGSDDGGDNPVVKIRSTPLKVSLPRSTYGVVKAPTFEKAAVRGQLAGLKSNTAGDWMLTIRVDADCDEEVTKLAKAHGLALEIAIRRKPRDE